MIRRSITPEQADIHLSVPPHYVGKKVEVLLYTIEELNEELPKKNTMADFWGKISDETAQKLHTNLNQMRDEWERDI